MVKRCSAAKCYNSQLTHKIGYFGFPKNEKIAREWAILAGRHDLVDKKLANLTKYYICSDHFTPDCFVDANVEDSLKRLNKLYETPMPSIFENNLMKNVKSVCQNPQKFANYTKHSARLLQDVNSKKTPIIKQTRPERAVQGDVVIVQPEVEDEMRIEFIDETLIEPSEQLEEVDQCRLCASNSSDLLSIFNESGQYYDDTKCLKLMPENLISFNDGLPQAVCTTCLEKLQSCANIIDGFVLNQNLF